MFDLPHINTDPYPCPRDGTATENVSLEVDGIRLRCPRCGWVAVEVVREGFDGSQSGI